MLNASEYIDILASWLRSIGVTVELYAHDLPWHGGLYRSETREVFLNVCNAESALMTLAHEAGHHIGYLLAGERNDSRPALHRERQAYVYGWMVLCLIGADALITREQWIAECKESHRHFLEAQRNDAGAPRTRFQMADGYKSIPDVDALQTNIKRQQSRHVRLRLQRRVPA
jgi:hypothetical protein